MSRGVLLALFIVVGAHPAIAQTSQAPALGTEFLSRFDFYVSLEHLVSDDPRFVWDANWGGELDLVDYRVGRVTFVANYQTILGSEFRQFDPNQGNYILEGSASARLPAAELVGVFHHVSRHLSDRPKRNAVDWNMVGGRVRGGLTRGRLQVQGRADLRGVIQKTFVDYRWETDGELGGHFVIRPRLGVIAAARARVIGVDGSRNRGTQYGFRGEGGVRLGGGDAALELFVATERRIDPYQLEFGTATWLMAGFRLSSY